MGQRNKLKNINILDTQVHLIPMEWVNHNRSVTSVTAGWNGTEATTEDTFMEKVEVYTIFKIANFINTYWFPILIPIGLVGNTLSFLVMVKRNNRKMSTCIYMAAISINDNIMMCICFHDYLVSSVQIHKWNPLECKLNVFVTLFALQNCTFLILAMTLDKYIAIKFPHRAAVYSTPRRAKIVVVAVCVSVCIYNVPHFFISGIIGNQCSAYGTTIVISRVYSWFSFVLNAVIPFIVLIHMNYVIVKTVRNSRKCFRVNDTNTGMEARQKSMKSAEKQVTTMLLMVTTLFLILLCPTYFRFIYLVFAKRDNPLAYARAVFIFQITYKLYSSNSGINFFLYCISGQKFRNDLKELLCCHDASHLSFTSKKDESQSPPPKFNSIETMVIES